MKCPYCGSPDSKVIDSRSIEENSSIRRRRECIKCQARFNTFETVETIQIMVIKKDGSREYFDKAKMLSGIVKACQKRPVDSIAIANKVEGVLKTKQISSYCLSCQKYPFAVSDNQKDCLNKEKFFLLRRIKTQVF